jgi:hypothetical protein
MIITVAVVPHVVDCFMMSLHPSFEYGMDVSTGTGFPRFSPLPIRHLRYMAVAVP